MKVGVSVQCTVCHRTKQPVGRSAPLGMSLCDSDCAGYRLDPKPGVLWPRETEEDFGYAIGLHGWKESES